MSKTFTGFGFGPIQSALFLYEAWASGNFSRLVVAEVDKTVVAAVRNNHGRYVVNIARRERVDRAEVGPVEILNPLDPTDRRQLVAAVAESSELATALPSVDFFDRGESSVAAVLAEGLLARRDIPAPVIYAAENHNHAAEILAEAVARRAGGRVPGNPVFLNTVIGKMSGVLTDPAEIAALGLVTLTPGFPRAVLVEEFNRILVSRPSSPEVRRGIGVFAEKDDLLPFEEAKLYGHNAIHALLGYLAARKGYATLAGAGRDPELVGVAREAFLHESGAALVAKYARLGDALFTPEGFRAYAEDLLDRMTRPTLHDRVDRVIRDPARKLGWNDRIFGTMRRALSQGITPRRMALGAAAAIMHLAARPGEAGPAAHLFRDSGALTPAAVEKILRALWGREADALAPRLVALTVGAMEVVDRDW
ncbi:MAG: hypothetical protein V1809_15455 [Planctomycetota bacterium]